ncbi:ABC transporter permease [Streptomyces sp. NPDC059853]|uniref:ABC transporter permease n=1 Tax=Streptomyces sp. NPDC059853 TaxID=3346973 RepID=UPI0036635D63
MTTPPPPQQQYQQAPPQQPYQPPQQAPGQPPQQPYGPPQPVPQQAGYPAAPAVGRAHLGHALRSEWTKIRTVRSTVWTLALLFVLTVGIGSLFALALSGEEYVGLPLLAGTFFGLMFGQICVITLGVLVISSEYGTGMMRTTLTASPNRGRILLAKVLVFFGVSFVMTLLATTLSGLVQSSLLSGQSAADRYIDSYMESSIENGEVVATGAHWLEATLGVSLYVSLLGVLGLAVGALLRHSAGAITTMMAVVLLPLLAAMFMFGESMATLRDLLIEYAPLNGLATLFGLPMGSGDDPISGWGLLAILAAATTAALIGAYAKLVSTDA